jgi:hypothetical protein
MGGHDLIKVHEFNGWRCDSCGELIISIEGSWVEWLASKSDRGHEVLRGLRLVHRGSIRPNGKKQGCRYDSLKEFRKGKTIVEGLPLERFVGPDGLMLLFSFLAAGNLPRREILELAKRVQIPGYELARSLLQESTSSKAVTQFLGHGCPAIGNPRNNCLGIGLLLKSRVMQNVTSVKPCQLSAVNTRNTLYPLAVLGV